MIRDLINALTLLTTLPAPGGRSDTTRPMGDALAWFPAIGLLLGVLLALAFVLFRRVLPDLITAALVIGLWVWLTGALHLEGLADAGDGLAATAPRERRLEIMRDPRVGAFGVVAVVTVLLVKFAAVASLDDWPALVLAPALARWAMVVAVPFPLARSEGMAVRMREGFGRRHLVVATLVAATAAGLFGWQGLAALAGAVVVMLAMARLAWMRLGGLSGDVYGAIGETVEVIVLVIGAAVG